MLRRRQREGIFEDLVGLVETSSDIAAIEFEVGANIGAFHRLDFGEIGKTRCRQFDRVVHQGRARFQGLVNVEHRRQLFVVDLDQTQRLFRRIGSQSGHRSHRVADVAHFFHRDNRLIFEHRPVVGLDTFVVQNIVTGQHRHHAGNF